MPPKCFESEVESFLEGSHGDRTHIKRADHHTVTPLCGTLLHNYPHSLPCGPTRYKTRPAGRAISRTKTHPHCTERSFLPRSPLPHRAVHSGRQCCLTEPRSERKTTPARGSGTPDETFSTPARGSGTPDETFSTPARHRSGHHEIFIAHTHPKCPISDHFHRAGAIFLSYNPSKHPRRGGYRRNQAHLKTQSQATEPEGHGRARPQKTRMQFDWKKFQQRLKTLEYQQSKFMV